VTASDPSTDRPDPGLELGLCILPEDVGSTVRYSQLAEEAGVGWVGICDSPVGYAEPHATIQAVLRSTATLRAGTLVTNPVTRHWSVQAGAFRTLEEIAPGRSFMGIGTGDTAVLDVGLRPAKTRELASYVASFREHAPESVPVLVAAGGPASVRRAAEYADELVLGQGAAREALEGLGKTADEVRSERSQPPAPCWMFLIMSLVGRKDEEGLAREDVRAAVIGQAAGAFSGTLEGKGFHGKERRLVERFTSQAGRGNGDLPGTPLTADEMAEIERVAFDRFGLVGTPEEAAERLQAAIAETGIHRVFLAVISPDPERVIGLATTRMLPRLLG
jgi:alkanesulfonate monooxygenase SsuD/methylene tetrahydromethanopterin reductase-like flavin-dependent oxidoreductase (luciferase family)